MNFVNEKVFNAPSLHNRYLIGLIVLLVSVWLSVLLGFHFYLEIYFDGAITALLIAVMSFPLVFLASFKAVSMKIHKTGLIQSTLTFWVLIWLLASNTAMLYFTGGKINPLIHILLLPLVFGMLLLSAWKFITLAFIAVIFYVWLNYFYTPIMSFKVQSLQAFFSWHLHGSMLVFMFLVMVISVVIWPLKMRLETQNNLLEKKRNEALQQEYLMATASLAAASVHKLSTPLNSVQLLQDLLAKEVHSEQAKNYLNLANDQIDICIDSLQALRDKAHVATKRQLEQVVMVNLISEIKEEFALLHPASELKITIQGEDVSSGGLNIDPTFKLALLNLCDNAARYSPDYVHLKASKDEQNYVFTLIDQGGGLEKGILATLGQGYYNQAHGMGMGVFISRMIIERFSGKIHFENVVTEKRQGLKVEISIPLNSEVESW